MQRSSAAKRMRLVHRRKERVLTRSTVPLLSQLNYRLSRCCYCSEEKRRTKGGGVRERKEGEESYSRLLDSMGKGLLVASGLAYEY